MNNYPEGRDKWLTVAQLKSVLADLPDDWLVQVNQVGNLAVIGPDGPYKVFAGYIDFLHDGEYKDCTSVDESAEATHGHSEYVPLCFTCGKPLAERYALFCSVKCANRNGHPAAP